MLQNKGRYTVFI